MGNQCRWRIKSCPCSKLLFNHGEVPLFSVSQEHTWFLCVEAGTLQSKTVGWRRQFRTPDTWGGEGTAVPWRFLVLRTSCSSSTTIGISFLSEIHVTNFPVLRISSMVPASLSRTAAWHCWPLGCEFEFSPCLFSLYSLSTTLLTAPYNFWFMFYFRAKSILYVWLLVLNIKFPV